MLNFYNNDPSFLKYSKMPMNDFVLLLDLFANSEETKLLVCPVMFCLVFKAQAKWRVELRAKKANIVTDA